MRWLCQNLLHARGHDLCLGELCSTFAAKLTFSPLQLLPPFNFLIALTQGSIRFSFLHLCDNYQRLLLWNNRQASILGARLQVFHLITIFLDQASLVAWAPPHVELYTMSWGYCLEEEFLHVIKRGLASNSFKAAWLKTFAFRMKEFINFRLVKDLFDFIWASTPQVWVLINNLNRDLSNSRASHSSFSKNWV